MRSGLACGCGMPKNDVISTYHAAIGRVRLVMLTAQFIVLSPAAIH